MRDPRTLLSSTALLLLLAGCADEPAPSPEPVRSVVSAMVEASAPDQTRSFSGLAQASSAKAMSFRVSGEVARLPVEVGDRVRQGQVIARLDPVDYEISLREAEASVLQVRAQQRRDDAEYERTRALYEQEGASKGELDAARATAESTAASLSAAQEQLRSAQQKLSYTTLQAPADGAVSEVPVSIGENVASAQTVVVLQTGSVPEVVVGIPELLIGDISQDDTVTVRFDALPNRSYGGAVTEVGVAPTSGDSTFPVTVRLDATWNPIRPGLAARVAFRFDSVGAGDVIVPPSAVARDREGHYVFLLRSDDGDTHRTERRAVEVGPVADAGIVIRSGLSGGETIVVAGVPRIRDGLRVRPIARDAWY